MFGLVSKKKLIRTLAEILENNKDSTNIEEYYFNCGCANAINYITYKLNIENKEIHDNMRRDNGEDK